MTKAYIFWGKVKKGKGRGKNLGFPTANIFLHKNIPEGIYSAIVAIKGLSQKKMVKPVALWYEGAAFIGSAQTFGEKDYKAEVFIFDFSENIYGKWITIKLLQKIRDNKKFASEKLLLEKMSNDIKQIKSYFYSK